MYSKDSSFYRGRLTREYGREGHGLTHSRNHKCSLRVIRKYLFTVQRYFYDSVFLLFCPVWPILLAIHLEKYTTLLEIQWKIPLLLEIKWKIPLLEWQIIQIKARFSYCKIVLVHVQVPKHVLCNECVWVNLTKTYAVTVISKASAPCESTCTCSTYAVYL